MRETAVSGYIWFGSLLRYLQDVQEGWLVQGEERIVLNLRAFLAELEALGLTTTKIVAFQAGLPTLLKELEEPDCKQLSAQQAMRLSSTVRTVRRTLDAEAVQKKAFVVSPKRGWDVDRLLNEPSSVFGEGIFGLLGEVAQYDFQEACRCLAFERPTASAFHLLRGTEAVLRDYYCSVVKQRRLESNRRQWHAMVEQMRGRRRPPPAQLLDALDQIRRNYRNPTQHPEAIYDLDQALDLMGLCIPVVNQMAKSLSD